MKEKRVSPPRITNGNRESTQDGCKKNTTINSWHCALYTAAWVSIFFLIPSNLIDIAWIKKFTDIMVSLVPSIRAYANNSLVPDVAIIFWSMQWALTPLYLVILFKLYLPNFSPAIRSVRAPASPWVAFVFAVLFACVLVYLPQEIKTDPRTIHATAQWERLMREFRVITAVIAVTIPIVFSVCILCAAGFFKYIFFSDKVR